MPFLTKADLTSIIYEEDINVITEGDDSKVTSAIDAATGEASGYMDRYDIDGVFALNPKDPILFESCKAIACWYLIAACPANQNTKDIKERVSDARTWLLRVQSGKIKPRGWPSIAPPEKATFFHMSSNPKRGNHF